MIKKGLNSGGGEERRERGEWREGERREADLTVKTVHVRGY